MKSELKGAADECGVEHSNTCLRLSSFFSWSDNNTAPIAIRNLLTLQEAIGKCLSAAFHCSGLLIICATPLVCTDVGCQTRGGPDWLITDERAELHRD